jgi:hypothetical protein
VLVMMLCKPTSNLTVFTLGQSIMAKIRPTVLRGVPDFGALARIVPLTQGLKVWCQKLGTLGYHTVKTASLYLICARFGTGTTTKARRAHLASQL